MPDQERIILDIPRTKGNGEVIRCGLSVFKGQEYFSVRVWFHDETSGELRPGKNGLNLPRGEFPEFERCVVELRKALVLTSQPTEQSLNYEDGIDNPHLPTNA